MAAVYCSGLQYNRFPNARREVLVLTPPDQPEADRMRDAFDTAAKALDCQLAPTTQETWSWNGRALAAPVSHKDRTCWLRVTVAPLDAVRGGPSRREAAASTISYLAVPRPAFLTSHRWEVGQRGYQADLEEHLHGHVLSRTALAPHGLTLSEGWWSQLGTALHAITQTDTEVFAVRPERVSWVIHQYIGAGAPTDAPWWDTAHADLHWSNLGGTGSLEILGWDRWGMAPEYLDAATLYVSSLTEPDLADRVRTEFRAELASQSGRFALLYVCAEHLHGLERGNHSVLWNPVNRLVRSLL